MTTQEKTYTRMEDYSAAVYPSPTLYNFKESLCERLSIPKGLIDVNFGEDPKRGRVTIHNYDPLLFFLKERNIIDALKSFYTKRDFEVKKEGKHAGLGLAFIDFSRKDEAYRALINKRRDFEYSPWESATSFTIDIS